MGKRMKTHNKASDNKSKFQLSVESQDFIKKELTRYESKRSAVLPALYQVQKDNGGWISQEAVSALSEFMQIPEAHINEVLQFYTMFNKKPVGKYHIQVCCNLTCSIFHARQLVKETCKQLKVKEGDVSENGLFTISRVECLGSCDNAPAVQINDKYYDKVDKEKMNTLLESFRSNNSTINERERK